MIIPFVRSRLCIFRRYNTNVTERRLTTKHLNVGQGGSFFIDLTTFNFSKVKVSTGWIDHCEIECEENTFKAFHLEEDHHTKSIFLTSNEATDDTEASKRWQTIHLRIPELFNLSIAANVLDLNIKNKLLGDFSVDCVDNPFKSISQHTKTESEAIVNSSTSSSTESIVVSSTDKQIEQMEPLEYIAEGILASAVSNIVVDKVRGDSINIRTGIDGRFAAIKGLEGTQIVADCGVVDIKLIHASEVKIIGTSRVNIGAMYSTSACEVICSEGPVSIGLMEGPLRVRTDSGDIRVVGITGAIDIHTTSGDVYAQINGWTRHNSITNTNDNNNGSKSKSRVVSESGKKIQVNLNPEMRTFLQATSLHNIHIRADSQSFQKLIFADHRIPDRQISQTTQIDSAPAAASVPAPDSVPVLAPASVGQVHVEGIFTGIVVSSGKSNQHQRASTPSFLRKGSASSGKINLRFSDEAEKLASQHHATFASNDADEAGVAANSNDTGVSSAATVPAASVSSDHALQVLCPRGSISVEAISWIEKIRRKHFEM